MICNPCRTRRPRLELPHYFCCHRQRVSHFSEDATAEFQVTLVYQKVKIQLIPQCRIGTISRRESEPFDVAVSHAMLKKHAVDGDKLIHQAFSPFAIICKILSKSFNHLCRYKFLKSELLYLMQEIECHPAGNQPWIGSLPLPASYT